MSFAPTRLFFLLSLLWLGPWALGQYKPGPLHDGSPSFSHQYTFLNDSNYYFIDTSFKVLHWYRLLSATVQDDYGYATALNAGGFQNNLLVPALAQSVHYDLLQDHGAYQRYFTAPHEVPFFQVKTPLTEALYSQGIERGQVFTIAHTQNINRRWNAYLRYRRLNSQGEYLHNQNKLNSLLLSTHYAAPNGRYRLKAFFVDEKVAVQQNGGLQNDSVFEDNLESNRNLLLVNLRNDQRVMRNQHLNLRHSLDLTGAPAPSKGGLSGQNPTSRPSRGPVDSLALDSVRTDSAAWGALVTDTLAQDSIPSVKAPSDSLATDSSGNSGFQWTLGHHLDFRQQSFGYIGQSSDYYQNYYFQSGEYRDSFGTRALRNDLFTRFEVGQASRLSLTLGAGLLLYNGGNAYQEAEGTASSLWGRLEGRIKERFELKSKARFYTTGPYAGNFNLEGALFTRLFGPVQLRAGYTARRQNPTLMAQRYFSNNFIWDANFDPVFQQALHYGLQLDPRHKLEVRHFNALNYVYFNAEALPAQTEAPINYTQISTRQDFTLWDLVHLDNKATYQLHHSGEAFMPRPDWVLRHALYFDFTLFDDALEVITGAELSYFSSFDMPSYVPALGRTALRGEGNFGDYPYLDIFAQFKVMEAHIYLRYQHVNQGLSGFQYYAAPGYPMIDRHFRLGIRWRFFQ
ncbi:MAG: putative porin [Schleiferiaceae bacterium]|nr:putative porin [Schleiferiaceae bacterium]MDR9443140.1 putative porin [Schleiferiaceae bacterium]